ncbi:MAG: enoyl-CoA hydratase-related protein [Actinomycetota bacterium]|nr:enoyl-CoA hydratase-related protein [Actinomycetota bacterium]
MHQYEDIVVDTLDPAVARITLNRPDRMNAYTSRMAEELTDAVTAFGRDDELRALVVTGAGRGFCSGGDVRSNTEIDIAHRRMLGHATVMREGFHRLVRAFAQLDKPVVAAINGPAVAGGLVLALLCDFRVASARATFGDPSGTVGLLPDEGGAWLFPRTMGLEAALRMTLLGERYDADRALQLGLVGDVVPHDELPEATAALARQLAERAPLSVRLAKRMMLRAMESSLEQALSDAELAVMITNDSADFAEGLSAFTERRTPRFEGR